MNQDTSDGSAAQLERADVHTVVGGTERLPQSLSEVIEPEGAAETDSSRDTPACVAWVFAEGADPRQATLDELPEIAADDERFVWVDLDHYDAPDLEGIARQLDLPEGAVRIALSGWQRPRVSVFRDRFFVAATVPHGDPASERLLASELDLFVGRNSLVSAHKRPLPFTERALARAVQNPALLKLDSAFLPRSSSTSFSRTTRS
jgi:Mg2+ and Co2+ transporter CorA